MTSLSLGLTIAVSAIVFFLLSGGKRWRWVLPLVGLFLVVGVWADFWFKQLPQAFFAALPLAVTTQAAVANLLGFIGIGGAAALLIRGVLASLPKSLKEQQAPKAESQPE